MFQEVTKKCVHSSTAHKVHDDDDDDEIFECKTFYTLCLEKRNVTRLERWPHHNAFEWKNYAQGLL
jgi:hypothetical protein